ncbi:Peroxisome size and maintenance regulator [Gnomoniopsis smithogilvyi]|uniref:Peroxisome size and maintenance regulator n=1 Tax=Gnomoniopsis smithogilvyi TaxID=1191159 RepID=A0A9W8Z1E3_9PEZI|nr:Peroxisome size and maintenance regulator [Gnomoniopsis smithogilvyi]
MDDSMADILDAIDASTMSGSDVAQSPDLSSDKSHSQSPGKYRWRSLSALKAQASMQDKLLEKLIQQVMPAADLVPGDANPTSPTSNATPTSFESSRPPFTPATMATNFTRFNARIGVVFKFQTRAIRLFLWRRPSQTLSFLAVYTLVCLDPYLLTVLPLAIALIAVFIPAFMARHPPSERELAYSPSGPPRAPPRTGPRPARQMSTHFLRNMRDLQNMMEDFSRAHDQVVTGVVPMTNFSDEALSSGLFVGLFAVTLVMFIAAHLLPWRAIALCAGWVAVISGHPKVSKMLTEAQKTYFPQPVTIKGDLKNKEKGPEEKAKGLLDEWVAKDIILDSAPETREVEIFELQHLDGSSGEWEPWLFSPSPYDPLSQARIMGERPKGTHFFEDVRAPEGWEWSEKKWALDLWSREWVEERIITGVEVETEGERWVYDMYNENEGLSGIREVSDTSAGPSRRRHTLSWEEGEEGEGRRGEWRRRRWVRLVKRKVAKDTS